MYSHADIHSLSVPKKASSSTVSNLSKKGEQGDLQDVRGSFTPIYSTSFTGSFSLALLRNGKFRFTCMSEIGEKTCCSFQLLLPKGDVRESVISKCAEEQR